MALEAPFAIPQRSWEVVETGANPLSSLVSAPGLRRRPIVRAISFPGLDLGVPSHGRASVAYR